MKIELEPSSTDVPATPSRLINLRLHESELAGAQSVNNAPVAEHTSTISVSSSESTTANEPSAITVTETTADSSSAARFEQSLALNIAADYTAASLDATMANLPARAGTSNQLSSAIVEAQTNISADKIAAVAAEAIAAIRSATDPDDVVTQITKLERFSEQLKSHSSTPEVAELVKTIDNFINIVQKTTGIKPIKKKPVLTAKANRAAVKITKSSAKVMSSQSNRTVLGHAAAIKQAKRATEAAHSVRPASRPATVKSRPAASRPVAKNTRSTTHTATRRTTSVEADRALRQAMRKVATSEQPKAKSRPIKTKIRRKGGARRFAIAFGCTIAAVVGIVYFVTTNIPDVSVRVAAMQTGVEASYPSYVPRSFSLKSISSEDGRITLNFESPESGSFTLIEEKSSWDSAALQRNYVEPTWNNNYSITHEQGITIYISGTNAAWVNGGVLYKINSTSNALTKKQLRNIVTSM